MIPPSHYHLTSLADRTSFILSTMSVPDTIQDDSLPLVDLDFGDLVELTGDDGAKGKRSYVFIPYRTGDIWISLDDGDRSTCPVPRQHLQLLRKHKQVITTRICDFVAEPSPCLGFAASTIWRGADFKLDSESPIGKLPRPCILDLSGPHTADSVFIDGESENLFRAAYFGKGLIAEWSHVFHALSHHPCLLINWYMEQVDGSRVHLGTFNQTSPNVIPLTEWHVMPLQEGRLTRSQATALSIRVNHLFLRVVGYDTGYNTIMSLSCNGKTEYLRRDWWKEALDLAIVYLDCNSHFVRNKTTTFDGLFLVGEMLVACGKFSVAAQLYGRAWEEVNVTREDTAAASQQCDAAFWCDVKSVELNLLCKKALALIGIKRWEEAEESLLCALRVAFQTLTAEQAFQDMATRAFQKELVCLYVSWFHNAEGSSKECVNEILQLLLAMYQVAGTLPIEYAFPNILARHTFRRSREAKKALRQAFLAESVVAYHAKVRAWKREGANIPLPLVPPEIMLQEPSTRKFGKERTRGQERNRISLGLKESMCSNPNCTKYGDVELMTCAACKSVNYCSPQCQKSHWKEHRPDCKRIASHLATMAAED